MTTLDRSAVERMEQDWRLRGVRAFSLVIMVTLAGYAFWEFNSGHFEAALATAIGLPVVAITFVLSRSDAAPSWTPLPLTLYLLVLLAYLLATEHANSAVVMFLGAGPAIAIFGFGRRWGLFFSAMLLAMVFATFRFNEHQLPPEYENRFIAAFVLTMIVAYIYEYTRTEAVQHLAAATERIETLESLLPMCAWCGKVDMSDSASEERWVPVEQYLEGRDQHVTHGLCPDCYAKELARVERELP